MCGEAFGIHQVTGSYPTEKAMHWSLEKILRGARSMAATDVHLSQGVAPILRINGELKPAQGPALEKEDLQAIHDSLLEAKQKEAFARDWQLSFSRTLAGIGRFRVSVYLHAGTPEFAIRLCETVVRTAEDLGLPAVVAEFTRLTGGLILVTGPTGMGKTTTLNYMVHTINEERRAKIITLEDPVEYVHSNIRSLVIQQELLCDFQSFNGVLRAVLRQDPDVIVIGEMRDLDTIETALMAAETGHLVIATLHTPDAAQTLQRIASVFPQQQQESIASQLAGSLQGIVSQRLLPRATGSARVLAAEVCVANTAVRNMIREGNVHQLRNEIMTGRKHKMQLMDNVLLELYQRGEITYDVAVSNCHDPDFIRQRTQRATEGRP